MFHLRKDWKLRLVRNCSLYNIEFIKIPAQYQIMLINSRSEIPCCHFLYPSHHQKRKQKPVAEHPPLAVPCLTFSSFPRLLTA